MYDLFLHNNIYEAKTVEKCVYIMYILNITHTAGANPFHYCSPKIEIQYVLQQFEKPRKKNSILTASPCFHSSNYEFLQKQQIGNRRQWF